MQLTDIQAFIPQLRTATAVSQIHKGFSYDSKYLIYENSDNPTYVLRTATISESEKKRLEFETIGRVHQFGVRTSEPIAFGTLEELKLCYMVLRYVEGEDALEKLPSMSENEQYDVGVAAGRELRLMHSVEAPMPMEQWSTRRIAKHNRQMDEYFRCGVKLPEEAAVIAFIDQHLPLLEGRPNRFQHDDFHPANLLIHHGAYAAAIDFNRYDWGDPYHDFFKVAYFSREVSIPFSIGQIDGYFDGNHVQENFWNLYALYAAMTIFGTITWTLKVVPKDIDSMMDRIRTLLDDHRNFTSVIPNWYKQ
ncbi:aminoglycoside phosphotransferase family protein [Paenibacillus sp. OV219]|uniref:aminoglycoside phosphotransferase family protein n=1 Tax=Paenibacillus sp. OV219 TaxID=1884377 RepID=UPI0008C28BA5|nr:phosphotransferase [Paenibacillus sp. OV219]SEM51447.1 Predicted kinase, aminoglycoside phosphotransferase (APT) family [Paenibacillus sp. OV219]